MSNGDFWTSAQWAIFNGTTATPPQPGLLVTSMGPARVAQHVFPTTTTGTDVPIAADVVDISTGLPSTGATRAFATLRKPFVLAPLHVLNDPNLTVASNQVSLAGGALALAEDSLYFRGRNAPLPKKGVGVVVVLDDDKKKLDEGLLGVAAGNHTIDVTPEIAPNQYGLETYKAVVAAISQFSKDFQGPPYALILSPRLFTAHSKVRLAVSQLQYRRGETPSPWHRPSNLAARLHRNIRLRPAISTGALGRTIAVREPVQ
jgi:hypothetical protein